MIVTDEEGDEKKLSKTFAFYNEMFYLCKVN